MNTRLISIISLVLALSLAGNVQAQTATWNDGDAADHLWSTPGNWSEFPTPAHWAKIRNGAPGPTIVSEGAVADRVHIGYAEGGFLTVDGGTLTTAADDDLLLGKNNGSGVLNMISGAINVGRDFEVGSGDPGIVNMTGGTIIVGDDFTIPELAGSTAQVNLDGGTIILDGSYPNDLSALTMSAGGTLNITAGTLIIDGDVLSTVQGYIDNGWITGYAGDGTAYVDYTNGQTTVYAVHALDPLPTNGVSASAATDTLRWTLPDPNSPISVVTCDVIFGTDPNITNQFLNTLVVDGQAAETAEISVEADQDYYWQITVYDSDFTEPILVSPLFTFNTRNVAPTADAGDDIETWLVNGTRDITLAGAAIDDDGPGPYSYIWEVTSDANDLNPATLDDPTLPNAIVSLPEAGDYTLSLIVNDGADSSAADTIRITVYADSCEHAKAQDGFVLLAGDTDGDCDVDLTDLANVAATWLQDNYSTE